MILNSTVLPFFDKHGISVLRILTDNGKEYCGRQESHHYQYLLYLNDIEHSRTKARYHQANGAVENLHQTIQNKFYSTAFQEDSLRIRLADAGEFG